MRLFEVDERNRVAERRFLGQTCGGIISVRDVSFGSSTDLRRSPIGKGGASAWG